MFSRIRDQLEIRNYLSSDPLAKYFPSGENATVLTQLIHLKGINQEYGQSHFHLMENTWRVDLMIRNF